jgi:hypothetical protein
MRMNEDHYRKQARQCRVKAERALERDEREAWTELAAEYDKLANTVVPSKGSGPQ